MLVGDHPVGIEAAHTASVLDIGAHHIQTDHAACCQLACIEVYYFTLHIKIKQKI